MAALPAARLFRRGRADELLRLRNLPITPTRAVVEICRARAGPSGPSRDRVGGERARRDRRRNCARRAAARERAGTRCRSCPRPSLPRPQTQPAPWPLRAKLVVSPPATEPAPIAVASARATPAEPAANAATPVATVAPQTDVAPAIKPDPVDTAVAAVVTADPAPAGGSTADSSDTQVASARAAAAPRPPFRRRRNPRSPPNATAPKTVHAPKRKKKSCSRRRVAPAASTGVPGRLPEPVRPEPLVVRPELQSWEQDTVTGSLTGSTILSTHRRESPPSYAADATLHCPGPLCRHGDRGIK